MMTVDELAVVLLELAQTARQDEWIAQWRPELVDALVTVTQWALGRIPAEIVRRLPAQRQPEELGEAALLFVRRVCFASDASYYEIFGLTPETVTPKNLRARYRALIRLTHPDVGVKGLPANAASLVNRAYAVLGSASARRAYDEQLAVGERPPPVEAPLEGVATAGISRDPCVVAPQMRMGERILARWVMVNARWSRQLQMTLIGAALLVPLGLFLAWSLSGTLEVDTIVVRAPGPDESVTRTAVALGARRHEDERVGSGRIEPMVRPEVNARLLGERSEAQAWQRPVTVEQPIADQRQGAGPAGEAFAPAVVAAVPGQLGDGETAPDTGQDRVVPQLQVDWPAARRYLQDIALAVDNETEAESLNHYLERMNVKGSLLQPIMDLHQRYGSLSSQYSTWSMAEGHGLFDAQTMLTIRAAADGVEPVMRSFLLHAQFQATESGTRLETLDFQSLE